MPRWGGGEVVQPTKSRDGNLALPSLTTTHAHADAKLTCDAHATLSTGPARAVMSNTSLAAAPL